MTTIDAAAAIFKLSTAYWASRCLHVIAELGVADVLHEVPQTAAELALRVNVDGRTLHRVMRALANQGIFYLKKGRLLSAALDRASELAYEGRERIQGLREGTRPHAEIGHVLEEAAREMVQGTVIQLDLKVEGRLRQLRPPIWEELYRIGHEALWNACRHARASQITVCVSYGDRELAVVIGDDGCGIAPGVLQAAQDGHFGLAGIRERARGMKARLSIDSGEGRGTRVEVRINSPVVLF